jgi:hypothetical protein
MGHLATALSAGRSLALFLPTRPRPHGYALTTPSVWQTLLDRRHWVTREQLRLAITTWIEHTYNRRRRQRRLGKLTPVEFELAVHNRQLEAARSPQPPSTKRWAVPSSSVSEMQGHRLRDPGARHGGSDWRQR